MSICLILFIPEDLSMVLCFIHLVAAHLFRVGGTRWKNLRSKFSSHFSSAKLRSTFQIQVQCGKTLETYLTKELDTVHSVEIKSVMSKFPNFCLLVNST